MWARGGRGRDLENRSAGERRTKTCYIDQLARRYIGVSIKEACHLSNCHAVQCLNEGHKSKEKRILSPPTSIHIPSNRYSSLVHAFISLLVAASSNKVNPRQLMLRLFHNFSVRAWNPTGFHETSQLQLDNS